jgi:3-oxoacyl-[acyl-carrier protein] reductase
LHYRWSQDLQGQAAIVTGGARGIGRAICLELADHGANILATDLLENELHETATRVQAKGVKCLAEVANVTEPASVERLVSLAVEKFGKLDIMVNNAGITRDTLVLSMSDEQWDVVLNVNLRAVFLGTRAAAKVMLRQRSGRIINMASFSGLAGNAGQANYAASKAGVIGLTKSVAKEVGKRGVLCNAVAPGFIETDMTAVLPEKVKEVARQIIPLQRMGQAEEVARVVAFLAGPGANYITGQVLSVDGGLHM